MREYLPTYFAVYRRKHNGNFEFQVFHATPIGRRREAYEVKLPRPEDIHRATLLSFGSYQPEEVEIPQYTTLARRSAEGILTQTYPTRYQVLSYGFWHEDLSFPFIPLVVFQNERWIPANDLLFKVRTTMTGTRYLEASILETRAELLRNMQRRPRGSMSPPPIHRRRFVLSESDDDSEGTRPPHGGGDDSEDEYADLPPLERIDEAGWRRVAQPQPQPLPLPKEVGETLIDAAIQRGEDCPILYNKLRDCDSVSITSCFHTFDTAALESWRLQAHPCPICRTQIVNVVTKRLRG